MDWLNNKTPEERKASAAKGLATRRANIASRNAEKKAEIEYAKGLSEQISDLQKKTRKLQPTLPMNSAHEKLTGMRFLLCAADIARVASPWENSIGVYFLLDGNDVVYIGQSVNVYVRISSHVGKKFDRYAFIPCSVEDLDRLESLYIHLLRPKLNGRQNGKDDGVMCAPISLDSLLAWAL